MRRLRVSALAAATAFALIACGGSSFVFTPVTEDASIVDAASDSREADDADSGPLEDAPHDATADVPDARGLHDATQGDAVSFDANPDVVEEAPAHCGGAFACAPAVPAGWNGPFELYAGSNTAPACGAGFSGDMLDGNSGLSAAPASCGCTCGPSAGVQCSSPDLTFYASSTTCSLGESCASAMLTQGACTQVDLSATCGAVLSTVMSLPQSTASGGSCAPVSTASVPPFSWSTLARACGAAQPETQADCAAGGVCVASPSSPFRSAFCIEQPGNQPTCPSIDGSVGYTSRFVYFATIDDTRGCTTCTCGQVTGASCSGTVTQFQSSDGGCDNGQIIYPLGQTCDPVQQPADLELALTASGGACAASPTGPTGSATPSNAMTFCCTP
jgi:hypothetical protein